MTPLQTAQLLDGLNSLVWKKLSPEEQTTLKHNIDEVVSDQKERIFLKEDIKQAHEVVQLRDGEIDNLKDKLHRRNKTIDNLRREIGELKKQVEFGRKIAKVMMDLKSSHCYFIIQQAYGKELTWEEAEVLMEQVININR